MFLKGFFLLCLAVVVQEVVGDEGCPDPEEIKPCFCKEDYRVLLKCEGIKEVDTLKKVFKNARSYQIDEFELRNSTLQYIPHELFDEVKIKFLFINRVTFVNSFDEVPKDPGVERFLLAEVRILGGWDWSKLSLFTKLTDMVIAGIPMKRISADFRSNINKKMEKLGLNLCGIKSLRNDEFQEFKDLQAFSATYNEITTVKRSMFARPSKLRELDLEHNKISAFPADMFQDMPNLDFIGLNDNRISALPWNTYKPVIDQLEYLRLEDNPLRCDCDIQWLLFKKIQYLYGECASPPSFKGKELRQLKPESFRC